MHAIATWRSGCGRSADRSGGLFWHGGFLSKEAAGVYSTKPKENWSPVPVAGPAGSIDEEAAPILLQEDAQAVIQSYTVAYKRGAPQRGYVLARTDKGRILARAFAGHRSTLTAWRGRPIGDR